MTENIKDSLSSVLLNAENLPWEYALYIPSSTTEWTSDLQCMILDPEETDNPDDDPEVAKLNGLKYALMVADLQDVVDNVNAQRSVKDISLLVKALKHYYDYNAFMVLS